MKNIDQARVEALFSRAKTALDEIGRILNLQAITIRAEDTSPLPAIEKIDGNEAPWVLKAREFFGKDEKDNNAELQAFLGINPEQTPWCAYFADKVLGACGLPTVNSGVAADFANYGEPCEVKNGAIAVFEGHVGFVVNDTKILGGNQGDMVKENNLAWYEQNKQLLGYRCPEGYELL